MNLHDSIRRVAIEKHLLPAVRANRTEFSIQIRNLMEEAASEGISPDQRVPAFCRSIQTRRFLDDNGLSITRVDGPKSGLSTTVVVHYRIKDHPSHRKPVQAQPSPSEERTQRALDAFDRMRGLLKDEIAAFGGAEAFIRWVRSDEDEDVA
jgi:hypothetical protein